MERKFDLKETNYRIEISKLSVEDGGGFLAIVPTLPGCMSDGETQEEALVNLRDAIKCWIETAEEIGREIPCEEEYKSKHDYSGKLSLRIPKILHKQISERAEKEACSINQLIMMYISTGIGYDYGNNHFTITVNKNNETGIIERLQKEVWKDYLNISTNPSRFNVDIIEDICLKQY